MFRPTGFADLVDRRVGVFGYGVEGHATARRLASVTAKVVVVDDEAFDGALASATGGLDALATCDVVLKSPGIPRRRPDVIDLEDRGVVVTSALDLWLHEVDLGRVIAVTGTKGKSTTTSLIAFFLRCLGEEAHELGNIGQPPYDPDVDVTSGWLVLEVSSFQSVDITVAPSIIAVTSLGSDHLDWHGSLERYHEDKLTITRASGEHITMIAESSEVERVRALAGGHKIVVASDDTGLAADLGLLGVHNDHNVGLALAVCARALGRSSEDVRAAAAARATQFVALPGRLTLVATVATANGATVRYVDDGLATAPLPAIAALDVFDAEPLVLIAGGFDRGVDYQPLVIALGERRTPTTLVSIGPAGERLRTLLEATDTHVQCLAATNMTAAVQLASAALLDGGVVLMSPAAPSFDAYKNWSERSDDFARAVKEVTATAAR